MILTDRQAQILQAIVDGANTDDDVAAVVGVTTDTIRSHMETIRRRLNARSKTQAVVGALRLGEITLGMDQAEYGFLDDFLSDNIETKRAHGGNPVWLINLGRKVLGAGWADTQLEENGLPNPHHGSE